MVKEVETLTDFTFSFKTKLEQDWIKNRNFYYNPSGLDIREIKSELLKTEQQLQYQENSIGKVKMQIPNRKFTVAIIGNESSGKTTLAHTLMSVKIMNGAANTYRILEHGPRTENIKDERLA